MIRTDQGIRYYFDPVTGERKTGWIHYGVNDYYFDPKTGRGYKGWHYIEGKRYFFNAFCQLAKNRFVGNTYFVDAEGKMVTNTWILSYEIGADGKKTGKTRAPGLFSENGKTWLLDENYEKVTGWRKVDEKWYHFDTASGEMDQEKWVDGYYLKKDGSRTSGQLAWIDGETYLFLEDGSKAKGLTEYEGKKYYFSTVTGSLYQGFKVIEKFTYYFDPKHGGAMAVDTEVTIDGMIYLFDQEGHMKPRIPDQAETELGKRIAAYAQEFVGYPYKERGDQDLKQGVDCSGFTMLVMRHFGINIPRTTWAQHDGARGYKQPMQIPIEDRKPGDLIFYYGGNSHVGIYLGNDKVGTGVEMCPISNLQTKAVNGPEEYPMREFLDQGLLVTVNTDNRTVSNTTVSRELSFIQETYGIHDEEVRRMMENAVEVSFADDSVKDRILKEIRLSLTIWFKALY